MHGSVMLAKVLTEVYYGKMPGYNYYSGCSTGGRQGLKEVEIYHEDSMELLPEHRLGGQHICKYGLEGFLCKGSSSSSSADCLSAAQLHTLYDIYNDYVDINQTFVFPHLLPGRESQWAEVIINSSNSPLGYEYVQYFLGMGPQWSPNQFDYSIRKGGKLLMYHGMADGFNPTETSIASSMCRAFSIYPFRILNLYDRHCRGSPDSMHAPWYFAGPNQASHPSSSLHSVPWYADAQHDILLALIECVGKGVATDSITATTCHNDTTQSEVYRQRPLCVYPKKAFYKGHGDPDLAKNWECRDLY
ncbi:conserved hypothetical protein [Talaromyces stipitatus ATCC 10500]|uniref:Carboxylic ester hydrolase n=1 Tax=Talaromyces stipitatus (strain ATCC 10500 / CBS 375.48 / QM 6759 / NRRL 1006) TaxID=441959 RepID=B8MQY2_TALSN|nr:uncharacterized protein TSTA_053350 [Talaromyces stipitatus ATCC 10500]EED12817.1 conserved hypothetical protein [Talaromyces stipitatus ATCC 10500]